MGPILRQDSHVEFIRTPRYLWPFNSTFSAFWPPLGFCSLAASLRERCPHVRLSILDCPALKIGWKSLERRLRARPPDVVCIGEETVSSPEGRRLARLAKTIDPRIVVIAGGVYFSYAVEETFGEGDVDYIVRGEGERTFVELVRALMRDEADLSRIRGLAYQDGNGAHVNAPRAPVMDLDSLPRPAYDLLDVDAYGRHSRNHPRLACLEHGRGCIDRCSFCILWKHFGACRNGAPAPCYRTKSAERSFEEVRWLVTEYDRKTIHFVDPCFNVDPGWTDRFADLMLGSGLDVRFTAWMRADFIVRDEELGILDKLVRAGLVQAYIGIERVDEDELRLLNKHHNGPAITRKAVEILRSRYPQVFTIGTVIYGMPWESERTLAGLRDFQYHFPLDYAFYIPLAPNPGTDIRDTLVASGCRMSDDFREYNFFTPVADTEHLTRRDLEDFYSDLLLHVSGIKLASTLKALRKNRSPRNRRVYRNLLSYAFKVSAHQLARRLLGPLAKGPTLYAKKPKWYDG